MKILYLHQHFATRNMPGITRTFEFAKRLVANGHEVHIITADQNNLNKEKTGYSTIEEGIIVHWLPIPYSNKMGFWARMRAFMNFVIPASFLAMRIKGDVIYASSPPLTVALPAIIASKRLKIPLVLEVRDLWPELPIVFGFLKSTFSIFLARTLEKIAYKESSHIVALSPGMKLGIIKTGYPSEQVSVIPNSCDHDLFGKKSPSVQSFQKKHPLFPKKPFVLYAGTIGQANGIGYIARLAKEVAKIDSNLCFVVMGEGKEENQVYELALELGVLNRNFFLFPPVQKSEISAVYKSASIILNVLVDKKPLWNSSPNKFFDALAASKPIAINYDGWLANLVRIYDCGIVLPADDFDLAAHVLVKYLKNPKWMEKAGKSARRVGLKYFSRDQLADQLESILLQVTGTPPAKTTQRAKKRA